VAKSCTKFEVSSFSDYEGISRDVKF